MFRGKRSSSTTNRKTVSLRVSRQDDASALAHLAGLDSRKVPPAPMLLAEDGDHLLAAVSLRDGSVVADPFHATSDTVELLRKRASKLGR
jgi:hypothetical protein